VLRRRREALKVVGWHKRFLLFLNHRHHLRPLSANKAKMLTPFIFSMGTVTWLPHRGTRRIVNLIDVWKRLNWSLHCKTGYENQFLG
jgi:hypothetical protein